MEGEQDGRLQEGSELLSSVHRENSMKSMASVELMVPSTVSKEDRKTVLVAEQDARSSVTSPQASTPVMTPTSVATPILPMPASVASDVDLVTPTAQSFDRSKASSVDVGDVPPPVPSKSPVPRNSRPSSSTDTTGSKRSAARSAGNQPAVKSPVQSSRPTEDSAPPARTTDTPPLPDSRPGTPSSNGSANSKRPAGKTLSHKGHKSISNFFSKDKEGSKEKDKDRASIPLAKGVADVDGSKDKEKTKRGSAFGAPFKNLVSASAGKKKEKEKDETVS